MHGNRDPKSIENNSIGFLSCYRSYLFVIFFCSLFVGCSHSSQTELQWHQETGYRWADIDAGSAENPGFNHISSYQTGIHFTNHISEKDIEENEYYMNGSGVAAADVDNDGLVDLYFAQLDGPNRLYKNLGGFKFREITESAGVAHEDHYSTGVTFADVDNDNDPDLLVSSFHKGVMLYLNNGGGRFQPSRESRFNTTSHKGNTTMALSDMDGDGDLDLYITNYTEGNLPITRQQAEKDQLFMNDGAGKFSEVTNTENHFLDSSGNPLGLQRDWGLAAKFQDLNNDGLFDLYVCNDFSSLDRIWINQGSGVFKAAAPYMFTNFSFSSMAVDFSDINRDGATDVFVTEMLSQTRERSLSQQIAEPKPFIRFKPDGKPQYRRNSLYLNRGNSTFAEISYYSGVEASGWSWGTKFMDVDLDGYEDLVINTGFTHNVLDLETDLKMRNIPPSQRQAILGYPPLKLPNKAFRNNGDLTFSDVSSNWGFEESDISHGMAVADFDQDGDLDMVSNRLNQTATVFENRTSVPRIAVHLVASQKNLLGTGTQLKLTGGPVPQQKQITTGGDYLSSSEPMAVFAADSSNPNHQLVINWSNGKRSIIDSLRANRIYDIQDPATFVPPDSAPTAPQPIFKDISANIDHSHQETSSGDFDIQPLLPYHLDRLGPGISWIDYDRDGDDDLFIAASRGNPISIYQNNENGNFKSVALDEISEAAAGDQTTILGWGTNSGTNLLIGSANYEQNSNNVPLAYKYDIEGQSVAGNTTSLQGDEATTGPMTAADYDNDGDLDLFVGGRFLPGRYPQSANSKLFKNENGLFQLDKQNSNALERVGLVTAAVFSDYDLDGDPDLIMSTEWGSIKIFQNNQGKFREVTRMTGLEQYKGWWNGIATGDFNNDGRPDIIATNLGLNSPYKLDADQPLKMFYQDFNQDSRTDIIEAYYEPEKDAYVPRRRVAAFQSITQTILDNVNGYNEFANATLQDLLQMNIDQIPSKELNTLQHMVFMNEGESFDAYPLPIESQFTAAFSANVADFNSDGNEDLFLSQNIFSFHPLLPRMDSGRGLWLQGDGQGHFTPIPVYESGIEMYGDQRGAALSDINMDGRVDLAVGQNDAPTKLFLNQYEKRGLRIRLIGPSKNRDAIGSNIQLIYEDGQKGPRRQIQAGSGYWSQNSTTQVLGQAGKVAAIEVTWFDGTPKSVNVENGQQDFVIKY